MKIRDIKLHLLPDIPLSQPVRCAWSPGKPYTFIGSSFLEIQTDEGITGYGPPIDEGLLRVAIAPLLIGQDPFAWERNIVVLRKAGGGWGLEVALWDIIGKACGQPLYKLWGGYSDRVRAYASTMEVRKPEQRVEDALRFYEEGWRAIKLRIHDWEMADDIRPVEAVRKAVGDRMEIMVDANQAQVPGVLPSIILAGPEPVWDFQRALDTARELQRLGVRWLEEPLDRYDWEGLAKLCEMAEMHHKVVVPHTGWEAFGFLAHVHLAAAVPNCPYVEVLHEPPGFSAQVFQTILAEPLLPDANGDILAPQRPGLGVEPRADLLAAG
jgi:L-alanine-DL-glutamate epimerase-like enolase superfamily enzyme